MREIIPLRHYAAGANLDAPKEKIAPVCGAVDNDFVGSDLSDGYQCPSKDDRPSGLSRWGTSLRLDANCERHAFLDAGWQTLEPQRPVRWNDSQRLWLRAGRDRPELKGTIDGRCFVPHSANQQRILCRSC